MRRSMWLLVMIGVVCLFLAACASPIRPAKAQYGESAKAMEGGVLLYPDFTLKYVGQHRTQTPSYPRGFLYYDFEVKHGEQEQTVSWTTGTGVIGPVDFEFDGAPYTLELTRRNAFGPVDYVSLVVGAVDAE